MGAPKKNQYYKLRLDLDGDSGKKVSPENFLKKAKAYIEWVVDNPLMEIDYRGKDAKEVTMYRKRAMTIQGLCMWMGIGVQTLYDYAKEDKYSEIVAHVDQLFYAYNFEGAAAGLLKENIIARKLGLTEKLEKTAKQNVVIETSSPEEAEKARKAIDNLK